MQNKSSEKPVHLIRHPRSDEDPDEPLDQRRRDSRFGQILDANGRRVPLRRIELTDTPSAFGGGRNPVFFVPDTSGPFGADNRVAGCWSSPFAEAEEGVARGPGKTQLSLAQWGVVTPEMDFVAARENQGREAFLKSVEDCANPKVDRLVADLFKTPAWTGELVRREVAAGRAVIPANRSHRRLEPTIIGKAFRTKINANFGATPGGGKSSSMELIGAAMLAGADTVMDLSVGPGIGKMRREVLRWASVPVGTVPIYEALERAGGDPEKLDMALFARVMREQAADGVDYMTIHAGVLRRLVEATKHRLTGIVSRGGGIMAAHMHRHGCENFLYENFDEILEIAREYDVTLSLGDGLRSGSTMDANDAAQWGELEVIAELGKRAQAKGVQVMIEGPGHIPMPGIAANQELNDRLTGGAPFYTLGPLVTDSGAGWDHVTAAIGGAMIGAAGASMLCFVTPKEHLGLPDVNDLKEGMAVFRIAAHAADIAKGRDMAILRDRLMSAARFEFRWRDQYALSFDPKYAERLRGETLSGRGADEAHFCSMCGPKFCPMKIARDWFKD